MTNRRFLLAFAREDFVIAATEMIQLYFPGMCPETLDHDELQRWRTAPAAGDIVFTGQVTQEHGAFSCQVTALWAKAATPSEIVCHEQIRILHALPWENSIGAERRGIRLLVNQFLEQHIELKGSPWGILRGIRPTKLVHRLLDDGETPAAIQHLLRQEYGVYAEKSELVTEVAQRQRPFLLTPAEAARSVSVYIGIPFCPSRCLYCSFPAYPIRGAGQKLNIFVDTLRREIEATQQFLSRHDIQVQTLYLGGGTPTSLPDGLFERLLVETTAAFGKQLDEFTVEAGRPETITLEKLSLMRRFNVGRISINPQTMRARTLDIIGRSHRPEDIEHVFMLARQHGFGNINMDIIAGLPGETPEDMAYTLERIGEMAPENLTVHTLAVKRGSRLKESVNKEITDAGTVHDMVNMAMEHTKVWGMQPYYLYRQKYMAGNLENVGYALPGKECLYNIQIMEERQTIIGLGASAGTKAVVPGKWTLDSIYNPKDVPTYINEIDTYLKQKFIILDKVLGNEEESPC